MNDSESEPRDVGEDSAAFVEYDDQQTELGYDSGGIPLYILILWIAFIGVYIVAAATLTFPDLFEWIGT